MDGLQKQTESRRKRLAQCFRTQQELPVAELNLHDALNAR